MVLPEHIHKDVTYYNSPEEFTSQYFSHFMYTWPSNEINIPPNIISMMEKNVCLL